MSSDWVEMGRIGRPNGLRGAVHVQSWTDPPEGLLKYGVWYLTGIGRDRQPVKLLGGRAGSGGLVVQLEGCAGREDAERLVGSLVEVKREDLPALPPGEYYRDDLLGFTVRTLDGVELGTIERFLDMPANPVMVVVGERERWLPLTRQHLTRIDPVGRGVWVDWPADF